MYHHVLIRATVSVIEPGEFEVIVGNLSKEFTVLDTLKIFPFTRTVEIAHAIVN